MPEIINSEAETSEAEELDKLSKLEMKIEKMDKKFSNISQQLGTILNHNHTILNKLNETLT